MNQNWMFLPPLLLFCVSLMNPNSTVQKTHILLTENIALSAWKHELIWGSYNDLEQKSMFLAFSLVSQKQIFELTA